MASEKLDERLRDHFSRTIAEAGFSTPEPPELAIEAGKDGLESMRSGIRRGDLVPVLAFAAALLVCSWTGMLLAPENGLARSIEAAREDGSLAEAKEYVRGGVARVWESMRAE